jgi:hypothetical protein
VAAFIPIPAFLRLRGGGASQWSNTAAPLAEPAAGWSKAVVATVLLVAGGAGVAGHTTGPGPDARQAAPVTAPAPASYVQHHRASAPKRPSTPRSGPARDRTVTAGSRRSAGRHSPLPSAPASAPTRKPANTVPAAPPITPQETPAPSAPSARHLPAEGHQLPALATDQPNSGEPQPEPKADPVVNVPAPDQAYDQATNAVTKVNGDAGAVLNAAGDATGLGG